ncbi:DUF72 domain-containing protein [Paenibacillus thalictri]|uniref:DUF72 domain-containing protein n=1 Tax=Paenibacillus thalictri TaxID=2527873 RepID=A0A4Q9DKK5_9BACL|nr:DUF72 domain-containing protein [Paenibacillus thalictri]TBL72692.1 DUF72 domain-containing protein [Paenibacillus thalictri]
MADIHIGLAGWGDHPDLYAGLSSGIHKLKAYSGHFPLVEVDSSFYAIPAVKNMEAWVGETPPGFRFIVKAYQGMTGHKRGEGADQPDADGLMKMFCEFKEALAPMVQTGKLKAVLFQYPPWFACTKENVDILRRAREAMGDLPVALELRNRTWFTPELAARTLVFMEKEGWIHSICDEPQAGIGSIPIVLKATHPELTVIRFHGRNAEHWNQGGGPNWRDVRYLYRYSEEELLEWKLRLAQLQHETKEICIIFNNNSGGDAAANAKQLAKLLGIGDGGLAPRQLELF